MYLSFYSANCKAQDVFDFAEFEEKYGKNQKPAFLKSMAEARDARSGYEAISEETGGEKKRASRVSRTSEKLGYYSACFTDHSFWGIEAWMPFCHSI